MFPRLRMLHLDLDKSIDKETLSWDDPAQAMEWLRCYLVDGLENERSALHLFVHEEDEYVRACLWYVCENHEVWSEHVPLTMAAGLQLLRDVRRNASNAPNAQGRAIGQVICRWRGTRLRLSVDSPHDWDVRIYFGDRRPTSLPYELLLRGFESRSHDA